MWDGYGPLPWYRKAGYLDVLIWASLLISFIAAVPVCIAVLTGPVYEKYLDKEGNVKTWGTANRVVAVVGSLIFVALGALGLRLLFSAYYVI